MPSYFLIPLIAIGLHLLHFFNISDVIDVVSRIPRINSKAVVVSGYKTTLPDRSSIFYTPPFYNYEQTNQLTFKNLRL